MAAARRGMSADEMLAYCPSWTLEQRQLRAELNAAKEKAHRLEVAALKAQLRQQAPEKVAPAKKRPPAKR